MEVRKIAISEDNSYFRTVESDIIIQQHNAYNYVPIACMKVLELFGSLEYELQLTKALSWMHSSALLLDFKVI